MAFIPIKKQNNQVGAASNFVPLKTTVNKGGGGRFVPLSSSVQGGGGRFVPLSSSVHGTKQQPQSIPQPTPQKNEHPILSWLNDLAKGIASVPVKGALSVSELPSAIQAARGKSENQGAYGDYEKSGYNLPWLGNTKSYTTDILNTQDEVIRGDKPMSSMVGAIAKPVVELGSLAFGGKGAVKVLTGRQALWNSMKLGGKISAATGGASSLESGNGYLNAGIDAAKSIPAGMISAGVLHGLFSGAGKLIGLNKSKKVAVKNKQPVQQQIYQPQATPLQEGGKINPLIEEARKYKSADEFVKNQPVVYHGSPTPLKRFSNKKGGVFFTDSMEDASGFGGNLDNVYEGHLNFKKPLVIDARGAKWNELNTKYGTSTQEVLANAQKDGYDGITFKNIVDNVGDTAEWGGTSTIHYAYKPEDAFLNGSQLKELWTKNKSKISQPQALQEGGNIESGFKKNLAKDKNTPKSIYDDIPGYEKVSNPEIITRATQEINADPQKVINEVITGGINTDKLHNAKAQILIRKLVEDGQEDLAHQVATATSKNATEAGRTVQIYAAYRKTTPEGALRDTYKLIDDFNAKNPQKPVSLTPEKSAEITDLANKVQELTPNTREWTVAAALLEKAKSEIIPVSKLGMLNKIQTMAQLLNPKTFIRNIGGNTALDVLEDVSRAVASGIDKALYGLGFVKERNVVMPNLKTNWLNKMTGFKMGAEDVKSGIRTSGAAGKYDIVQDAFAKGSIMNKLEKVLGYELSTFDKAFYQGRYMSSLENIMKAKGVSKPTPIMQDIANSEALYATFQNNSGLANLLSKSKSALNFGKDWGLGDLIIKYPKTPGNIVSVGMDYSPIGFVKGLKQFFDSVKMQSPTIQREAVINIGRGITGSGLILGGAMMAKSGIITADPEKDPDIRQLKRESGQGPFSINLSALERFFSGEDTKVKNGDTIVSYDWLQPNAIQLSMGANMVLNKGDADSQINDAIDSLSIGLDTVTEQSVFSGVKRFVGNLDTSKGGSIGKAFTEAAAGAPSSFAPSILNQIGQYTENTQRETYDPSMFQSSINKIKARIPGLREDLQPRIGTMGNQLEGYRGGTNSLFNVFLNPAFVNKYNITPVAQEVIDIYNRTGETKQTPRIAAKNVKIDGQSYQLTPEQFTQYQTYIGQRTNEEFTSLLQDPYFQSLSDTEKANEMSTLMTNIGKAGREELAKNGGLPPSIEMQAKQFLKNRDTTGFVNFMKNHPEINTKADLTRLMNEVQKESYSVEQQKIADEIAKIKRRRSNQPFYTK